MIKPRIRQGLFILCVISFAFAVPACKRHVATVTDTKTEKKKKKWLSGAEKQLNSWFWEKAYPEPFHLTNKYLQAWQQFQQSANNHPFAALNTESLGGWTAFGPKVFGGRVLSLAISPTAAASGNYTIYAGSASGGIWRSYSEGDGVNAWEPVSTGFPVLGVSSIVYHPSDSSVLLAGTGEVYRTETLTNGANSTSQVGNIGRNVWKTRGTYGIGILRSNDGGKSWIHVFQKSSDALMGIQVIRYDPVDPNIVYAAATDGLYRSTDGGLSWPTTPIWSGNYVSDVIVDPANTDVILLASGNVGNTNKGIWRSTNGGASFTQISPGTFPSAAKAGYRGDVKFSLAGSGPSYTLFASIGMNDLGASSTYNSENEVYRSTDFGTTWTMITNSNHASYQSWFSHVVTPFPGSTTKLFMAGVNRYVLTISGSTGTATSIGTGSSSSAYLLPGQQEGTNYLHADVHDVKFRTGSSTVAFFATDGGIFKTTNAGASPINTMTFVSCNGGLQIQQFYPTVAQSQSGTTIVGGLQDNNIIRYNGTGWAKVVGGDGGPCMFKPDNENIMLGSNDTRGVYASTNNGASFPTTVLAYLGSITTPYDNRTSFMAPIAVSSANTNRWYVASDNLHVSTLSGTTFGTFSNNSSGIPVANYIDALHKPAVAIGISSTNANKLYISTSPFAQDITNDNVHYNPPARIRRTLDGGSTFSTVSTGLPDRFVTDFAVSPTNDDSLYITLGGFGTAHIYVSGNGGSTWTPRGNGLPDVPFNTILIDPADSRILYAGCDFGVFMSQDRGATWYNYSAGMWDATYVMDLQTAPGNKIRAFTHGKGIFEANRWSHIATLPVKFRSIRADHLGIVNKVTWTTEEEYSLLNYQVERSTDGSRFSSFATVTPRQNGQTTTYEAVDRLEANPAPVYYYRVRSNNDDGTFQYSEVVMVRVKADFRAEILGNPFLLDATIRITAARTQQISFVVSDVSGRVIKQGQQVLGAGVSYFSAGLPVWIPSGTYIMTLSNGEEKLTVKLIKQ